MKYFSNRVLAEKIKEVSGETYTADEETLHLDENNEFSISSEYQGQIVNGQSAFSTLNDWFEEVNYGTEQQPAWVLVLKKRDGSLPRAFLSYGDQIVGNGTPGGGDTPVHYLNDLTDVTITSPINGQALVYQNGEWINGSVTPDLSNYYTKSETYSQAQVNALIGAIDQFHYEIYATLPATGEGNVLYLIGPTGTGSDKYDEYVYANGVWTKIGDTSIDLSPYLMKTDAAQLYHPLGGDDGSGEKTFKIGGATLTYHPAVQGTSEAYLELDCALLTLGDQIVGEGTPGGGGGGGASYLGELRDVEFGLSPSVGQILVYAANVPLNPDGTQYGPGWTVANMPTGDVTSISVNGQTYSPSGGVVTLPNYPTIPSTYAWSAITGTPTTLGSGGYGITDAKIENGVITLGSNSITPLTSHQTIYGLTLKVGTSTVGSYTPNSAAQTLIVTAQNLYDTIGSTKYHPYGGDTASNTFKIGGATLTWHPESSVGAGDAYLEIDSALLTLGDQIVMSGTPGGGGGGAGYLYELGDIYHDTDKTKVLRDPDYATTTGQQAQPGDVLVLDSTYGWAAVPSASIGGVTSVVGQIGDVTAQQISTAIGLSGYLPLAGGSSHPMTGAIYVPSGSSALFVVGASSALAFGSADASSTFGQIAGTTNIRSGNTDLVHTRVTTTSTIWDSGNSGTTSYAWKASGLTLQSNATIAWEYNAGSTSGAPYITRETNSYTDATKAEMAFKAGHYTATSTVTSFKFSTQARAYALCIKNDGKVGINTYSPDYDFHVDGTSIFSHADFGWQLIVRRYGNAYNSVVTFANTTDGTLGYLGMGGSGSSAGVVPIYVTSGSVTYKLLHEGNFVAGTNYVSITGTETITGTKTFTGAVLSIKYDNPRIAFYKADGTLNGTLAYRDALGPEFYDPAGYYRRIYHAGNSNSTSVPWSASYIVLGGASAPTPYLQLAHTYNSTTYNYYIQGYNSKLLIGDSSTTHITLIPSSSGKAFVGISTSAPDARLAISDNEYTMLRLHRTDAYGAGIGFYTSGSTKVGDFGVNTSGTFTFRNGSESTLATLNSSGNFTLGSSDLASTSYKLYVDGKGYFGGSDADLLILNRTGGAVVTWLTYYNAGSLIGRIGIGSDGYAYFHNGSTYYQMWHGGNSGTTSYSWKASSLTLPAYGTIQWEYSAGTTTGAPYITRESGTYTDATKGDMTFSAGGWTGSTDVTAFKFVTQGAAYAMCIKNNGKIGLGTTAPAATLQIDNPNWAEQLIINRSGSGGDALIQYRKQNTVIGYAGVSTNGEFSFRNTSLTAVMLCSSSGVLTTTGDQVISSDINLKTHFKDIILTSEQIANAPAVSFDWKDGHGHSFGSIAQYWKPLVPESVLGEEGSYTLAYGQLGVVLGINNGKAIYKLEQHETEQDKEIRKLKKEVAELRMDNLRLKARLGLEN